MPEIHRVGIGGSGRLMISVYLREHKNGDCYYARFKVSNPRSGAYQRYITESLRTNDLETAKEIARTRYAEISLMESQGKVIKTETVSNEMSKFIEEYKKGLENNLGSYSKSMFTSYRKTIVRYWKEYIGHLDIKNVNWDHINDYESWRQNYYKEKKKKGIKLHGNSKTQASNRTIESEINNFKTFLRWCSIKGSYFGNALEYKYKNANEKNKRSAFTTQQWTKLTGYMRRNSWLEVGVRGNDSRLIRYRHMLKAYVLFMKNTGLRVGESRKLRWSDVELVQDRDPSKNFIRIKILKANSKTRRNSISIGNEGAYNSIKDWNEYRKSIENFIQPNDYIWCDIDGRNIMHFREGFNSLIKNAGVELDASGNKLTCYSLRHTYITEQLKDSVPIYTIASNCNTSVAMIEEYYSDARNKDFEEVLTKGYRKDARLSSSQKSNENHENTRKVQNLNKPTTKPKKSATKTSKSRTGSTRTGSKSVR